MHQLRQSSRVWEPVQDIQMYPKHRKADPADSDFLEKQGPSYFNHGIRAFFHNNPSLIHLFPEPSTVQAKDDE